ncbi:hypothetical protein K402DRAFT_395290 [Aulographum hederae CBS 113979]|uniref:Uncharacterized protein n=1 Tax=Aulographum hederae CBS 113979 TaxID=1176131 RepID=A0A6G1GVY6_9PEZI|nr:hypothetical protein K402DRAFT_395290 [Aulographum hederae CBS 113979]
MYNPGNLKVAAGRIKKGEHLVNLKELWGMPADFIIPFCLRPNEAEDVADWPQNTVEAVYRVARATPGKPLYAMQMFVSWLLEDETRKASIKSPSLRPFYLFLEEYVKDLDELPSGPYTNMSAEDRPQLANIMLIEYFWRRPAKYCVPQSVRSRYKPDRKWTKASASMTKRKETETILFAEPIDWDLDLVIELVEFAAESHLDGDTAVQYIDRVCKKNKPDRILGFYEVTAEHVEEAHKQYIAQRGPQVLLPWRVYPPPTTETKADLQIPQARTIRRRKARSAQAA